LRTVAEPLYGESIGNGASHLKREHARGRMELRQYLEELRELELQVVAREPSA
jgi:hypothetical protein